MQLARTFSTLSIAPSAACPLHARPLLSSSRPVVPRNASDTTALAIRQQSTAARTRRALRVPPHPDFVIGPSTASSKKSRFLPGPDEVLFNPPAAAPSVYHTPLKFVPPADPRRRISLAGGAKNAGGAAVASPDIAELFRQHAERKSLSSTSAAVIQQAPIVGSTPQHRQLTEAEVAEMRQLRAQDPARWTVRALAQRFGAPALFVMIATRGAASREHLDEMAVRLERVKARWGRGRAEARAERARRKLMMERGEL